MIEVLLWIIPPPSAFSLGLSPCARPLPSHRPLAFSALYQACVGGKRISLLFYPGLRLREGPMHLSLRCGPPCIPAPPPHGTQVLPWICD